MKYPDSFLKELYWTMLKIRLCEESLVKPILDKEMLTPCHLYSGEEAIAAGVSACLDAEDYVFGNHRSHGHFLAKGGFCFVTCWLRFFARRRGAQRAGAAPFISLILRGVWRVHRTCLLLFFAALITGKSIVNSLN